MYMGSAMAINKHSIKDKKQRASLLLCSRFSAHIFCLLMERFIFQVIQYVVSKIEFILCMFSAMNNWKPVVKGVGRCIRHHLMIHTKNGALVPKGH